jgi:hypothetical protein
MYIFPPDVDPGKGFSMRRLIPGLVLAAGFAATATASAPILDGWGMLKFGMSPDQARALPGFSFGRYTAKDLLERNLGAMASKKPAVIGSVAYNFNLFFNAYSSLYEIGMWNEQNSSRAGCQTAFLALLGVLEKNYGAFGPVYPVRKKNDQDQLPMSIEWIGTPPHYHLATVYMNQETAYVWNGRKNLGDRYVDTSAVWSAPNDEGQSVCLTEIDFKS